LPTATGTAPSRPTRRSSYRSRCSAWAASAAVWSPCWNAASRDTGETMHDKTTIDALRRLGAGLLLTAAALLPVQAGARMEVLDRIAAVVNDSVIMESELDQRVDDLARQFLAERQQLPPRDVLRPQVLERLIMERLQLDMAERGGIRVDDNSLNQALSGIARQNNMTLDEFSSSLRADGFDWAAFREQIRGEMVINQLHQRQVARRVRITDREVERFLESEMGKQMF